MLQELGPGIFAWEAKDMTRFRSYAVVGDGQVVLVDPLEPDAEERAAIGKYGKIVAVLLTGAMHERDSQAIAERCGASVYAHPDLLPKLANKQAQPLPATLPLGIEALTAAGSPPGLTALYVPRDGGSLIVGDLWHNEQLERYPWPVRFLLKTFIKLRDGLHTLPPSKCENAEEMNVACRQMLEGRPVERLLVMHGEPVTSGARERMLARLAEGV